MVKRAYSKILKKHLSVEDAHKLSLTKELSDPRAFICSDNKCRINLTCTNWNTLLKKNSKLYFKPSCNKELHVSACSEAGMKEEKVRSNYELKQATATVQKDGLIVLRKISNLTNTINDTDSNTTANATNNNRSNFEVSHDSSQKNESSYVTSLLTLIEMYNDNIFNNTSKILKVAGSIISLDELFLNLDINKNVSSNKLNIFYGKAILQTFEKNEDMIEVKFINTSLTNLYSNKQSIYRSFNGKVAKRIIDKKIPITVYFRGFLDKNKKWNAFNGKVYKDIYLTF